MTWPTPSEFVEAIQNPQHAFSDPDLRSMLPALDRRGMPVSAAGQFAYVFKMNSTIGGKPKAVRCFRGDLTDRELRYQCISMHLDIVSVPQLPSFKYVQDGILVAGRRYPVVVMEWVEGSRLDLHLSGMLNHPDAIASLAEIWLKTLAALRDASIAHGDLQHGNIIVQNQSLTLVDLDGFWVPGMRGWQATELGHRHYQHPGRGVQDFAKGLDNFSGLVIYLSLMILAKEPDLWKMFHGENLIFTKQDFEQPDNSELFRLIRKMGPQHSRLGALLQAACRDDPLKCPSVLDLTASSARRVPSWIIPFRKAAVKTMIDQSAGEASPVNAALNPGVEVPDSGEPWWRQYSMSTAGDLKTVVEASPQISRQTLSKQTGLRKWIEALAASVFK